MSIDLRLNQLMNDGWNIQIECKAKGRVYELTYELRAYNYMKKDSRIGFGDRLDGLLDELFG